MLNIISDEKYKAHNTITPYLAKIISSILKIIPNIVFELVLKEYIASTGENVDLMIQHWILESER